MDHNEPSGPSNSTFSGANNFTALGEWNTVRRDMVVVNLNSPQPAVVPQNPTDAPRERRTNVDSCPSLPAIYRAANADQEI
jgi:hypothetical protein